MSVASSSSHNGDVILESPFHPVTEGNPLTLRCLYRNTKISDSGADFYKDDSVLQKQTTGEMTISSVSKSDEGFYHCTHPERGESPKSWVSVRGKNSSQTPDQNPGQSGADDSQSGYTPLQTGTVNIYATVENTGETAAEHSGAVYAQVMKKNELHRNKGKDAGASDVTYTELELKPQKKARRNQVMASAGSETVYSELK
ncbi:uncharacterized protein Hap1MRO34_006093 [Clarias gariepinus]